MLDDKKSLKKKGKRKINQSCRELKYGKKEKKKREWMKKDSLRILSLAAKKQ